MAPGGTDAVPTGRVSTTPWSRRSPGLPLAQAAGDGVYGTIEEMAAAEKINASYVGRLLRLTLLAPDNVEAILDGRQPTEMTLSVLMRPFPMEWQSQLEALS